MKRYRVTARTQYHVLGEYPGEGGIVERDEEPLLIEAEDAASAWREFYRIMNAKPKKYKQMWFHVKAEEVQDE